MLFTYTYRSSDGQRHTAEIEAESRDAAFAKVRSELGIKPIKVTLAEGDSRQDGGSPYHAATGGARSRATAWGAAILAAVALAVVGGVWWWFGGRGATAPAHELAAYTMHTPQGPVTLQIAEPLPRQTIPGNRQRIKGDSVFTNVAERLLSRFAEPGRAVAAPVSAKPTEAEFRACLREPIRVASNELTEHIDLKRIVSGMKREMRAYLAGGGNVDGYLAELEKRQKLEISYRENAERRLGELLSGDQGSENPKLETRNQKLQAAYAYWLKANAQLQAMGIYPLALPDALRTYQMGLDIDE